MMEVDGDRAMQEAPGSARVAVDFGHASGARAAAPLGADAAATTGGARGDDTCGLSSLGGGNGGRESADGHGRAGGAGQQGSTSARAVGASRSTRPGRSAGDDDVHGMDDDGDTVALASNPVHDRVVTAVHMMEGADVSAMQEPQPAQGQMWPLAMTAEPVKPHR